MDQHVINMLPSVKVYGVCISLLAALITALWGHNKMNWTLLNWIALDRIKMKRIELNWSDLNWTELNLTELNRIKLNWIKLKFHFRCMHVLEYMLQLHAILSGLWFVAVPSSEQRYNVPTSASADADEDVGRISSLQASKNHITWDELRSEKAIKVTWVWENALSFWNVCRANMRTWINQRGNGQNVPTRSISVRPHSFMLHTSGKILVWHKERCDDVTFRWQPWLRDISCSILTACKCHLERKLK